MIVHLTASRKNVVDNIATMRMIVSTIHQEGHVLSRDWMEPFFIMSQKGIADLSPEEIYKLNVDAVERADLVIVEGSESSFGCGLQVALAIQKKKPTLLLINEGALHESSVSKGIKDVLLKREIYSNQNLSRIIKDFLEDNTINTKDLRFNFVIDRQIYNHLHWKAYKTGKTKAEVVRDLLMQDIQEGL